MPAFANASPQTPQSDREARALQPIIPFCLLHRPTTWRAHYSHIHTHMNILTYSYTHTTISRNTHTHTYTSTKTPELTYVGTPHLLYCQRGLGWPLTPTSLQTECDWWWWCLTGIVTLRYSQCVCVCVCVCVCGVVCVWSSVCVE